MTIDEIVDRYEIKPGAEFLPEKPFRRAAEIEPVEDRQRHQVGSIPVDPTMIELIRQEQKEQDKRDTDITDKGQIVEQPQGENIHPVPYGMGYLRPGPDQKHNSENTESRQGYQNMGPDNREATFSMGFDRW